MKEIIRTRTGVVAMFEGKYWGIEYEDAHFTEYGFGPIENAKISDPKYCTKPTDMTSKNLRDNIQQLKKSKLVPIEVTTIYRTIENE